MRPASYESRVQRFLWLHNQLSVFVLVVVAVALLVVTDHAAMFERYRPYSGRVYGGIIGLPAVELLLWYFLYRHGGIEARWAAGLMGVWFALLILIALARASIDVAINFWSVLFFAYMLVSHASYAFLGSRARY